MNRTSFCEAIREMDLNKEEKLMLDRFRQAKKYAEANRQAELEIRVLPGGRVCLIRTIFQEKIEGEKFLD